MLLHASCIAIGDQAILVTGHAGSGKSDLALRLIDDGAQLISDDQTQLEMERGVLVASPPKNIAGLIEVRHIGLMTMPYKQSVPVVLLVDLLPVKECLERLPQPDSILLLDQPVPRLRLPSYAASTPVKIRAFLKYPLTHHDSA